MQLYFLPILLAVLLLMAVFVSYSIAVSLGHVPAVLPYISDTGVLIPERSIFSQLINLAVIVQILTFYVRFEQIASLAAKYIRDRLLLMWNHVSLWLGFFVSLGLSLIGNFQLESSNKVPKYYQGGQKATDSRGSTESLMVLPEHLDGIQKVHWTGAFLTFVGGVVWMFIQSWLTLRTYRIQKFSSKVSSQESGELRRDLCLQLCLECTVPQECDITDCDANGVMDSQLKSHLRRTVIRFGIAGLCLISLVAGIVSAVVAAFEHDETTGSFSWQDANHGLENWRGQLSIAAAFCEWILTLLVIAFTLTFVPEFQNLRLQKPRIVEFRPSSEASRRKEEECQRCLILTGGNKNITDSPETPVNQV